MLDPVRQQELWHEGVSLWQTILEQYGVGRTARPPPNRPRPSPICRATTGALPTPRGGAAGVRADPPDLSAAGRAAERDGRRGGGLDERGTRAAAFRRCKSVLEAMSPANFPLTNPVGARAHARDPRRQPVRGHRADARRPRARPADATPTRVRSRSGENIATTPGKVVHETPLYQLIQYSPDDRQGARDPAGDLPAVDQPLLHPRPQPEKSFVRWAVEQGLTVFMVSWRSADASMADVVVGRLHPRADRRDRHDPRAARRPAVHAIGYCVAGTTLAATLAMLAAAREADKVRSATFFTAQVDFERAGDLKMFVDDTQLAADRAAASQGGYLDGRYMAATFNMLRGRGPDLELCRQQLPDGRRLPVVRPAPLERRRDQPAGQVAREYLKRPLSRQQAGAARRAAASTARRSTSSKVETPSYIQAGREDHIAPAESVWRMTRPLRGPITLRAGRERGISPAWSTRPPQKSTSTGPTKRRQLRSTISSPAPRSTREAGGPTGCSGSRRSIPCAWRRRVNASPGDRAIR